jgi:hypothetical protein
MEQFKKLTKAAEQRLQKTKKWFYWIIFAVFVGLFIKDIPEVGGMSYDTDAHMSLNQVIGASGWSATTSVLFTIIMKVVTFNGAFTDGMIWFQFVAVAAAVTFAAYLMNKMKISRLQVIVYLIIFRLLQRYQIIIPVAVKDVLFGACVLAFSMCIVYAIYTKQKIFDKANKMNVVFWGGVILLGFCISQLRSNSSIIVIVSLVSLLVILKPYRRAVLKISAVLVGLCAVFSLTISLLLNPVGHPQAGLLSVPNTTTAAVLSNQNSTISDADRNYFLSYLDLGTWQAYAPRNADSINGWLAQSPNLDKFRLDEFLLHWTSLCAGNFKTCLKAFIELEGPFFDLRRENQYCLVDKSCTNNKYENIFDTIARRFSIYPYILIVLIIVSVRRKYWYILVPSLAMLSYLIMFSLAAPVVYLRYAFPVGWVILPLLFLFFQVLLKTKKSDKIKA